jgi:D-threo-aldose 1-dehydrogenase
MTTPFGLTGLTLPKVVFGNSYFGNLYRVLPDGTQRTIVEQWFAQTDGLVVIDSAGKYGAGLALENTARQLEALGISPDRVVISNKLAWKRVPLTGAEPTFETGVWTDLQHDAVQTISYEGILSCWEQGCELLGPYCPQLISVHDPDEYLEGASSPRERERRLGDIREAYRALHELKAKGGIEGVGVGSKDWRVIAELHDEVELDWVMFANSLTVMNHPPELVAFMENLAEKRIGIVNSAVFHGGFLTGGSYYDYRPVDESCAEDRPLFDYRHRFHDLCEKWKISPAAACIQFGIHGPGVQSIALNTSDPRRVKQNVDAAAKALPGEFWGAMKEAGLIEPEYRYAG